MTAIRSLSRGFAAAAASAALTVAGSGTATASPQDQPGSTLVPMTTTFKRCDFSTAGNVFVAGDGNAYSIISRQGNQVVAEVHLEAAERAAHHNVRLIQAPRSANSTCGAGSPGTTVAPLDTDVGGNGVVTLRGDLLPETTGAWVMIEGPLTKSTPWGQLYTSDFVASV